MSSVNQNMDTVPSTIGKFSTTTEVTRKPINKWLKSAIDSIGVYITLIVILIVSLATISLGIKLTVIIMLVIVVIVQILQLYKIDITRFL